MLHFRINASFLYWCLIFWIHVSFSFPENVYWPTQWPITRRQYSKSHVIRQTSGNWIWSRLYNLCTWINWITIWIRHVFVMCETLYALWFRFQASHECALHIAALGKPLIWYHHHYSLGRFRHRYSIHWLWSQKKCLTGNNGNYEWFPNSEISST